MNPGVRRYPCPLRLPYRNAIFRKKGVGRKIYLTFDDGPTARGTEKILQVLTRNNVDKAVFFCTGANILKYPDAVMMITKNGYSLANHGFLHLDGWNCGLNEYIDNCLKGSELSGSKFYRPPYGHIKRKQYLVLSRMMKIVLWDLLLYDFDTTMNAEYISEKANKLVRPGSVIVLHDKGNENTIRILESLISNCGNRGYTFGDLTQDVT